MPPRQRPVSRSGPPPQSRAPISRPTRKVFNCIVDDSALVAGVKRSTRNGIRQWVRNGQIRLFVPLHALEELSRQKNGKNKHAEDVRETLEWLDEATTKHPNVVTLQGADETYEKWTEVERFSVPRTLFSENNHELETESYSLSEETAEKPNISEGHEKDSISSGASDMSHSAALSSMNSVRSSISPVSPPTSPAKVAMSPTKHMASLACAASAANRPQSSSDIVPQALQPLFNYILWRIHQEIDPVAALESFMFLCNDPRKVSFAKGFDIKMKRLEQLREVVGREDRDYKNRQALLNRENQSFNATAAEQNPPEQAEANVVTSPSPPKAPAAMLQRNQSNVIDPNAFSRGPQPNAIANQPTGIPRSPRGNHAFQQRGPPHASHVLPFAPRGNMRGNIRGNFRGSPRGRGGAFGPGSAGLTNIKTGNEDSSTNGQIDPDSFTRPNPRGGIGGGRGGRKLWVPT